MIRRFHHGFSFLELFVGIVILFCGIIPILWVFSSSTQEAKLTVAQVQATNHAANLLEAVRAAGYDAVSQFPPVMVQLRGGTGVWKTPEDSAAIPWAGAPGGQPTEDQKRAFDSFRQAFFDGKNPIVPEMEDTFERYLVVKGGKVGDPDAAGGSTAPDDGMIGVIVRIEWADTKPVAEGAAERAPQHVELRTVLGDPYRFLGGGGTP